jgi:hypothetical protein
MNRRERWDFTYPPDFGLLHYRNRRLVTLLYGLKRADGTEFDAGTIYEVLRDNSDGTVNLCEVDLTHPLRPGRTIVHVRLASAPNIEGDGAEPTATGATIAERNGGE